MRDETYLYVAFCNSAALQRHGLDGNNIEY